MFAAAYAASSRFLTLDIAWISLPKASSLVNSSYNVDRGIDFELGRGIDALSVGRYREVLQEEDVRVVDWLCAPIMREHNYEITRQPFSLSIVPRRLIQEFAEGARTFGVSTRPMHRALLAGMQLPAFFELRRAAAG